MTGSALDVSAGLVDNVGDEEMRTLTALIDLPRLAE